MFISTVHDLNPLNFYRVGMTLKDLNSRRPNLTVNMDASIKSKCGTIACVGGWYSHAKGLDEHTTSYLIGTGKMANDLGFAGTFPVRDMQMFFTRNLDLWGNPHVNDMFLHERAYTGGAYCDSFNLGFIGDFFMGVGDRVDAKQRSTPNDALTHRIDTVKKVIKNYPTAEELEAGISPRSLEGLSAELAHVVLNEYLALLETENAH